MQVSGFLTGTDRGSERRRSPLEYKYLAATQIVGSVPVPFKKGLKGGAVEASCNMHARY